MLDRRQSAGIELVFFGEDDRELCDEGVAAAQDGHIWVRNPLLPQVAECPDDARVDGGSESVIMIGDELDFRHIGKRRPIVKARRLRIIAQRIQARMGTRLVGRHQPAVADYIGSEDCRQPALHCRLLWPGARNR